MVSLLKDVLATYSKKTGEGEGGVVENQPQKYIKSFELSYEEIRYALYQLLIPVENSDNEWYFIDHVYDDRFEYVNWEGTKIFRQFYVKDGDNVTFSGDRIELFQERMTKEEKEALDKLGVNTLYPNPSLTSYKEKIKNRRNYC
jgi:hypothetical protein